MKIRAKRIESIFGIGVELQKYYSQYILGLGLLFWFIKLEFGEAFPDDEETTNHTETV